MPLISICINVDTRPSNSEQGGMFNGVCNEDFLTDGIFNKIKFFDGFDIETIVFIDEHLPVSEKTLEYLRSIVNCVVVRKHTDEHAFNDINYLSVLSLARGTHVCHFDQDVAAFSSSKEVVQSLIDLLEEYKFISYPSIWSPNAVDDPTFEGRMWASTRFFICKRETLKFDTLRACIEEPEWAYKTFGDVARRCNWLEHFLTLTNGNSVYYPPIQTDKLTIFTWEKYETYTLRRLNEYTYEQIFNWHNTHPIFYPNNVNA